MVKPIDLEQFYDDLVAVKLKLYEFLSATYFNDSASPSETDKCLAMVLEAYHLLGGLSSSLANQSNLETRKYSYQDICWMPLEFVDLVNSSNLIERFCLLGEAVSHWNALHSHFGVNAPICPLLDPTAGDPNADPSDY